MMIAIYVVLLIILLFGAKFSGFNNTHGDFLSLDNAKSIQGFVILVIILHHLSQDPAKVADLSFWANVGVLCVGIFFFYSGYGVIKSLQTKENYLKGFLKKRLLVVLIPFFLINFIYLIAGMISGAKYAPQEILLYLTGMQLINSHAWYIIAIVIFYLAFYLLFKLIKKKSIAFIGMAIFSSIYIVVSLSLGHGEWWLQGEWWFNTSFLFFLGMLIGEYETQTVAFARKFYWVLLPVCIAAFILVFMRSLYMLDTYSYWAEYKGGSGIPERWICLAWQLPAVILFVAVLLLVLIKLQLKNVILKFLGSICLEIYLIHNLFIELLRSSFIHIQNDVLYVALVIVLSVASAWVIHLADSRLIALVAKKKKA